jgi:hypothetical protein
MDARTKRGIPMIKSEEKAIGASRRDSSARGVPIATGERLTTKCKFQQVLENNAAAIIQVNVGLNGSERRRHSASVDAARTCRASRTNRSRTRS